MTIDPHDTPHPPDATETPEATAETRIRKHSVVVNGHETSISLEDAFWNALKAVATERNQPVTALIAAVDRTRSGNLSSALRVFVLDYILRKQANA